MSKELSYDEDLELAKDIQRLAADFNGLVRAAQDRGLHVETTIMLTSQIKTKTTRELGS